MNNRITVTDYNADWAYKEGFLVPRSHAGYLTPEEFIAFSGTLGMDGIELMHDYWRESPPSYPRKVANDAGLPIFSYIFGADLAVPPDEQQQALDSAFALLDRTAELGSPLAFLLPGFVKEGFSLVDQRSWMIDGLSKCAEHAHYIGVKILIENLDYPPGRALTGRSSQVTAICQEIDSPGLGRIYDCGATRFVDEDPFEALEQSIPYLAHVHLKNNRLVGAEERVERYVEADSGRRYLNTALEDGEIDIAGVLGELSRRRYDGYMLIEYQGEDDPREAMKRNVEYLRRLMKEID